MLFLLISDAFCYTVLLLLLDCGADTTPFFLATSPRCRHHAVLSLLLHHGDDTTPCFVLATEPWCRHHAVLSYYCTMMQTPCRVVLATAPQCRHHAELSLLLHGGVDTTPCYPCYCVAVSTLRNVICCDVISMRYRFVRYCGRVSTLHYVVLATVSRC